MALFGASNYCQIVARKPKFHLLVNDFLPCPFLTFKASNTGIIYKKKYSQTSVHERLGSWTIRFTNKFSNTKRLGWRTVSRVTNTQVVPRDRKKKNNPLPNNNISLPHHLPVGLKQSRVVPRDRKKKKNPLPNNNISLPHHLPLTPSTPLHTGTVKRN